MDPKAMQFKGNGTVVPFNAALWATGQFVEWPPPAQKPEEVATPAAVVPTADETASDADPAPSAARRGRKPKPETTSPA